MKDYLHSLFSLDGKVAIVTGASRGIGAAIAHGLAGAGAFTIGLGRSSAPLQPVPSGAEYRQCDIADAGGFAAVCDRAVADRGGLDILVNAAGITLPTRA